MRSDDASSSQPVSFRVIETPSDCASATAPLLRDLKRAGCSVKFSFELPTAGGVAAIGADADLTAAHAAQNVVGVEEIPTAAHN